MNSPRPFATWCNFMSLQFQAIVEAIRLQPVRCAHPHGERKKMQAKYCTYTIWKNMAARHDMGLTRVERERSRIPC